MLFGIIVGLAVIGFLLARFVFVPMFGTMPDDLGWRGDSFKTCDASMAPVINCVSSTVATDNATHVDPFTFTGSIQDARTALLAVINAMPRSEIITNDETYIHVVFRSLAFNFPDDTEFYIDGDNNVIHVRSASRLGKGDAGVNRNRVETIREQFQG